MEEVVGGSPVEDCCWIWKLVLLVGLLLQLAERGGREEDGGC